MANREQIFLLCFLSTAGLIASLFQPGDITRFYENMTMKCVILITNIIVFALQMRNY
jgi:hypothetical protein